MPIRRVRKQRGGDAETDSAAYQASHAPLPTSTPATPAPLDPIFSRIPYVPNINTGDIVDPVSGAVVGQWDGKSPYLADKNSTQVTYPVLDPANHPAAQHDNRDQPDIYWYGKLGQPETGIEYYLKPHLSPQMLAMMQNWFVTGSQVYKPPT